MMFIYKIKEVEICVSLREQHDVTIAENDVDALRHVKNPIESVFWQLFYWHFHKLIF